MSEIKCNKLEITSLRQCDSIKTRGNIGPCIIEGPARQDSCQACQPRRSYWIWPVTHTQISPVKIAGYIDFLFFFKNFFYLGVPAIVPVCRGGAPACACSARTHTCMLECARAIKAGYKSSAGERCGGGKEQPHLELRGKTLQVVPPVTRLSGAFYGLVQKHTKKTTSSPSPVAAALL